MSVTVADAATKPDPRPKGEASRRGSLLPASTRSMVNHAAGQFPATARPAPPSPKQGSVVGRICATARIGEAPDCLKRPTWPDCRVWRASDSNRTWQAKAAVLNTHRIATYSALASIHGGRLLPWAEISPPLATLLCLARIGPRRKTPENRAKPPIMCHVTLPRGGPLRCQIGTG